jgi:ABC-type multidrug transport system ATPase subunit
MRLDLERVGKSFGRVRALDGVTLSFPAGARVALIGPNGSGKTTLIRALLGLVACEGKVLLGGAPPGPARADRVAYVPQIAPSTPAPVGELLAALARIRDLPPARIAVIAARLGLDLDTVAAKPFRALSGGTKQKVLLSVALATGASLFVLDEPTASLDAPARAAFFAAFAELAPSATLLLCSHRLEEIRHLVTDVVLLADGRVAWCGPVDRFLAARGSAVLEIRAGAAAEPWLRGRGFSPRAPGWWGRVLPCGDKLALLGEAQAALGADLHDLAVRDVDSLDPGGLHA